MKTKTTTQELKMLKPGFGKQLMLMAFFLLSFTLIKGQQLSSFTYSSATYCQSGSSQTPTITGTPGGVFSSTPAGLSINSSTGSISLPNSALGAFTVIYTVNSDSSSILMTITNATPNANFSYSNGSFCPSGGYNPSPIFGTSASAGSFSATPGGLVFTNVNTGEIDLNATMPGIYTVTNTIPASGTCGAANASTSVIINALPDLIATPAAQTFCSGGATSIALSSTTSGATFSWTVTQTGVSGAAPGSGSNIAQTLSLTGSNQGTANYTITPFANGCVGNSTIVPITVVNSCASGFRITSPASGATINNRCDLHFCVFDSLGNANANSEVWVSMDPNGQIPVTNYYSGSTYGVANSFCFTNSFSNSSLSGNTTFYLWSANFGQVGTVTVNIVNTINDLCSNLTYNQTALSGGSYNYAVTGLNPSETYTLQLISQFGVLMESSTVSNVSSGSLTHHFIHNGPYYPGLYVTACDGETCSYSGYANITNSSCSSYTLVNDTVFQSPYNNCFNGNTSVSGPLSYANLSANGTSYVIVNWGDGTIGTYPIAHNGNKDSSLWFTQTHVYSTPGVYSTVLKFYDAGACYNDSIIGILNVSSNSCGNLTGTVFDDANNNCSYNNGELGIANIAVSATLGGNTYWAWTDAQGNYGFNGLPTGSYTIQLNNINPGYTITCSNSLPHTASVTSGTTIENFAIHCPGTFDVAVTGISLMNGFYPGVADAILPHVGILNNACNQVIGGQVKMILDPCIHYTTAGFTWFNNPPAHVILASSGDTLVWNVSDINNIGYFSYWDYAVNITTCTSAHVGDTTCITMMVLPTAGDADPSNNTFTRCFAIGVSYDPNYKEVSPKGTGTQGFIPSNTADLTYTINFQNTGTAVARNIYVIDSIDTDLNINSIEILSASHGIQVYELAGRAMKFMFANIMLPDSTTNKHHSHGYVTFRIKPKTGLSLGTQIKNTGHIYFDYNEPVATNTTLNTIATTTGINVINNFGLLKVYPNPAKDKLIVSLSNNGSSTIVITDMLGKTVRQIKTNELQTQINVSDLQDGIYFIRLTQDNASYVEKIIISK